MGRKAAYSFAPAGETRKERKARLARIAELNKNAPERVEVERTVVGKKPPRFGDKSRPNNAWGPISPVLHSHRASSLTLSGAYPFIAEAGLGARGIWIGRMAGMGGADFVFDPWELYQQKVVTGTSIVLIGKVGSGKSSVAKCLITRSLVHGRKAAIASDPKGEWVPVAQAMNGDVISVGPGRPNRINPLDEGPRDSRLDDVSWGRLVESRRRSVLVAIAARIINQDIEPHEYTAIDEAIRTAVDENDVPTLRHVYEAITNPRNDEHGKLAFQGERVGHALRRLVSGDLQGIFDGPSTVKFSAAAPIVVMDTSGFTNVAEELADVATICAATWLEAAVMDPAGGKRYIVYDEGYRMLRNKQQLLRMSDQWKLARQYGLSNMLIMHRITDLDAIGEVGSAERALAEGLLSDSEIRIVYAQESDVLDRTKSALGLTGEEAAVIGELPQGVGLWKVGKRPFVVQNLLTPDEKTAFNTASRFDTDPQLQLSPAG